MTITLFQSASGKDTVVLIQGQYGALLLTEAEARELNGKLPHVLDPITPEDPKPE